ncbi:Uncharacterised protein [Pseudomonas fluorescens]|uniref:Uncharacterized protein n=1 Tax=Pseudomonas fluorescens TaxID=294 RepID=A0A379I9U2_PSEFL|nr:hypothetical protein [Pseudomonas fluorescens]AIG05291.1 hypothetical protein HZ99_25050 [Pseudomonas fluorescens]SUD29635.1 Uncharacterised protein [Pseudomonas fluorescens]
MRKTLLAISLLTTAPAALAEALPVTVDVIGDSVHYTGDLNADAVAKLADQVKASNGSVAKLVIDSGGGDVNVGMDLAEIVLAAELDVIVKRLCASSCANYVFPAGKRKQINPGAVVIWHGSAIQESLMAGPTLEDIKFEDGAALSGPDKMALFESWRGDAIRYVEDAKVRQNALFKKIGIDDRITVMGQQLKAAQEWTVSIKDMERFGIRNVSAADNYGLNVPAEVAERGVKLLRLDDFPDYAAALSSQTPG